MKKNHHRFKIWVISFFGLATQCAGATDNANEQDYFQPFPIVLSASRLTQPLSETPNAMTVIDSNMIVASGFRTIADLFKLVPGMYVSYYKGSQAIVAYHGTTDSSSRRMQVMIDGRSVYLPPVNTVDWSNLPITIDDIERIEVIRGPAAASYGANSTQGVINIITRDASEVVGRNVKYTHGNKGINDASAYFGKRGEAFDYRMTLGYTADNGYDALSTPPNNLQGAMQLLNNSNDNNQARLINYRGNYHPNIRDSLDLQFGFNHDIQGAGFNDKNPTPSNPTSTNGDTFHDLFANTGFMQTGWTHQLENASELNLKYYHIQENQHEALPVYLHGIYCPGPIGNTGQYCPGPVINTLAVNRDQLEIQHTLWVSESNRLVYGGNYQRNSVNGQSIVPPLSFYSSASSTTENVQIFANDEWRITPRLLINTGAMFEKEDSGHKDLSPRVSINFHATPQDTFRMGISVAYRAPALAETNFSIIEPGVLVVPLATANSPGLVPEKMVSHEIGYIGEFAEWNTLLDLRLFRDQFSNGIMPNTATGYFVNDLSAEYNGFEATLKKSWDKTSHLTINFAHEAASSNGAALAASNPFLISPDPSNSDILSASIPKNSASILYSRQLASDCSFSASYYYQTSLQPFDRGPNDFQPTQHRTDVRIARQFHDIGGMSGEVAGVVQNVFHTNYTEYIASNLFNQRAYMMVKLKW
jgi:iron complex outermembrane receptor protein